MENEWIFKPSKHHLSKIHNMTPYVKSVNGRGFIKKLDRNKRHCKFE